MEAMGTEVKGFDIPVCNSFKAKVVHDQLCYEVDLKNYEKKENRENELRDGLILLEIDELGERVTESHCAQQEFAAQKSPK